MNEEIGKHFTEIRNCQKCENISIRIDCQQPGYFPSNCKHLFILQNPAFPKLSIIPSDAILLNKNSSNEEFHTAYLESQKAWYFWKEFIKRIIPEDELKFVGIINICRCPTKNNLAPPETMVNNCNEFLKKSIELINPINIIAGGSFAKAEIRKLNISNRYNIIESFHYSFLLRKSREFFEREINEIKEKLK